MAIHPATLNLYVKDMGKALTFYRLLGLDIPTNQDNQAHVEARVESGYALYFDTEEVARQTNPNWQQPQGQRLVLAFKADSPDEVNAIYDKVKGAGFTSLREPWDAFGGQRYSLLQDADGNRVDVFAANQQ